MSNTFTETTSTSWFGRLRNSVGAVVIGLLLIVGMVVLLFWNEGRAVTTARSLAEGAGAVVSVAADKVDPANEGKLVHVSGTVTTELDAERSRFRDQRRRRAAGPQCRDVPVEGRIPLRDHQEARRRRGNHHDLHLFARRGTTGAQTSAAFKQPNGHQNPSMEIHGRSFQIPEAKLGAFTLDQPVLDQIGGDEVLTLKPDQSAAIEAAYSGDKKLSIVDGASISAGTRRRRRSATIASPTSWCRSARSA